jgi:hypothetical protein
MPNECVCFLQGSKKSYITKTQAAEYVREGYATWQSERCIKLTREAASRGLSCFVGAGVADAIAHREPFATAMLEDIRR